MIQILDKRKCCGCSACSSTCPKRCIQMVEDEEGFLYPQVDEAVCIDCGLCEKVCNELQPYKTRKPLKVLAAMNMNNAIRQKSSSGGIFYSLAEKVISGGGVVFGARFDDNWQVVIDYSENLNGVEAFMGSKYVQARIESAYKDAKQFLQKGRLVLFSGTPCQVAGLYKFLQKKYDNLLTVDFICHGTPSPKVWRMYLDEVLDNIKFIKNISFRNKIYGWRHLHFSVDYDENGNSISLLNSAYKNQYMKAFLADLILRPSCSCCAVKSFSSQSDITLADFWGIWNVNPEMNDDKGTTMLFINTKKGLDALPEDGLVKYAESSYETALKYNKACEVSVAPNPKRQIFFKQLKDTQSVAFLIDTTLKRPFLLRARDGIKCLINRILRRGGKRYYDNLFYINNPSIVSISFRNKENGWRDYKIEIDIIDTKA